jgi:GGDEF domain-containing protein
MPITKPRNRVVLFRLTQEEFARVQQACAAADARSVSDFARARILAPAEPPLAQLEARLADLLHAVERLTRLVESGAARGEAAAAGFGPYLAKSGD